MKIGITGSTCSGKTTFIDYLRFNLPDLRENIEIVTERASECPYPLNNKGGFRTQWWILSHHIDKEFIAQERAKIVVTDRTVFDSIPYLMTSSHTEEQLRYIITVARDWAIMYPYDYIMYFAPITTLKLNDGAHIYQGKIDEVMRSVMSLNIPHENIVYIPYAPKLQRCEDAFKIIKNLIK
jgi:hypothetical protein